MRRTIAEASGNHPLISILIPLYRPSHALLLAAIISIKNQIYSNFEIIFVDDGSDDLEIEILIERECKLEINYTYNKIKKNTGISQATNKAFHLSRGEIVIFMDQDDTISEYCLAMIAKNFMADPEVDLLYSDSDKLNFDGGRISPAFKPGWSPVLLLAYMYMHHVVAARRTLLQRVGALDERFDGSQDFDFALRASEYARKIEHIPDVLYHWRMTPGSTAVSGGAKSLSIEAGRLAVQTALARRGIDAEVTQSSWARRAGIGLFDLAFPERGPLVSIVIAALEGKVTAQLLEDIAFQNYRPVEVIIVRADNDDIYDVPCQDPDTIRVRTFICQASSSLTERYNQGAKAANGELLLFLSGSVRPRGRAWLSQLVGYASINEIGATAPRLLRRDGRLRSVGLVALAGHSSYSRAFEGLAGNKPGHLYRARVAHECAALPAEVLLTHRSIFEAVGGFDAEFDNIDASGAAYSEAVRRRGKSVLCCAGTDFVESSEPSAAICTGAIARLPDPFANPNLDHTGAPRNYRLPISCRQPPNVVFVSHNLEDEGAPITLFDLVTGLVAAGAARATIFSPRNGPLAARYRALGICVEIFEPLRNRATVSEFDRHCEDLIARYAAVRAELVIANTLDMFAAVNAASRAKLASLWCHHEAGPWWQYFRRRGRGVRANAYTAFSQAYRVVFVAHATMKAWLPLNLRRNFELIRYGIPDARMAAELGRWTRAQARTVLEIAENEVCILSLGSVCARKGQLDIPRAIAALADDNKGNFRVMIVGAAVEAKYLAKLRQQIESLPASVRAKTKIVGRVDDTSLYYHAADVFLCTSRRESAPRVIVEAMAFSLPIVTTPVDGIPELVRANSEALFYHPGKTEDLARHLAGLAGSSDARRALGERAQARVKDIGDFTEMIDRFSGLIREAVAGTDAAWLALPDLAE